MSDQLVRPLLEYMRSAPGVERIEASGSYRRRRETVGDIDLLAICPESEPVMRHFTRYEERERVLAAGKTRGTIVLKSGLHVDLRIVGRRAYGAALHYFTGSKAHNIAVRRLGLERGLRISEYGVYRVAKPNRGRTRGASAKPAGAGGRGGKARWIAGEREEEVFKAVGMAWVPPELREDSGEVEAALENRLPELVEPSDIRGDLQMHTTWTDGTSSVEAMARGCLERGYKYLAITDHSKAMAMTKGLGPKQLKKQWAEIDRAQRKVKGVEILKGLEVDILRDGSLDLSDEYLDQLDLVVVSVHSHMRLSRAKMTDRVIKAISHPGVHILGHPTGRIINRRNPYDIDIEAVLAAAAESGVAIELNPTPDRLDLDHVHVRRAKELGVPVVINTDAHSAETLRFMDYGVEQARRGWIEPGDVLNTRSLRDLRSWLKARRHPPAKRRRAA